DAIRKTKARRLLAADLDLLASADTGQCDTTQIRQLGQCTNGIPEPLGSNSTPDMQKGQPVCSIVALDLRCKIVNADAKKGLEAAHFHGCKNFAHIGRHPQYQRSIPVAPPKQGIMPKAHGVQGTETRIPWRRSDLFAE